MTSALQKSECCSATSAAQLSENCSATSVFACGMLQGWGLEGWVLGLTEGKRAKALRIYNGSCESKSAIRTKQSLTVELRRHPNGYQNCRCAKIASFENPLKLPFWKPSVFDTLLGVKQRTTQTGTKIADSPQNLGFWNPSVLMPFFTCCWDVGKPFKPNLLGQHICRTNLPCKILNQDTKKQFENAKNFSKKDRRTIWNATEKCLAPLRPLKDISPALF